MKFIEIKACTPKCKSTRHCLELIGLITKTSDTQIILSGLLQCYSPQKIHDEYGRYLLHMAASCGRAEVVEWLLKYKKADLHLKTLENGWTPAHCAAFYGNIDCLILLIKYGANLFKNDYDRLTAIDHLIFDKYLFNKYQPSLEDDFDVYSWGSNANFNLGYSHEMKKNNPEIVEYFKKNNINIIQIVISKFHSVFLAKNGHVYSCGFGIDGRLGHDNEATLISPKLIENLKNEKCIQVAASRNNTYFLTSDNQIFSCGTNEFKQLGQTGVQKSLSPRGINLGKILKSKQIKQIACSRFHVAILTSSSEVFTFGLNAGQIGHPNEKVANATSYNISVCLIEIPRIVTSLNESDMDIDAISCSDGATICLQRSKNVLHLFNDYKCKRLFYIKETGSPFKKIRIHGGKLDTFSNPDLKWIQDLGREPITIVGLTENNLLFIWRENEPSWRNACWSGRRSLEIFDFDLNNQGLIFSTIQGICYKADFSKSKISNSTSQSNTFTSTAHYSNQKEITDLSKTSPSHTGNQLSLFNKTKIDYKMEYFELVQIPFLNRCYGVVSDMKARNFFALQYHPNTNMIFYPKQTKSSFKNDFQLFLQENVLNKQFDQSIDDYLQDFPDTLQKFYDIQIKSKNQNFELHKFILYNRCPKFFLKFDFSVNKIDIEPYLSNQKFGMQIFELLINYIYTSEIKIDLIRTFIKKASINNEANFLKFLADFKEIVVEKFGFNELKVNFDPKNYIRIIKELQINLKESSERQEIICNCFFNLINHAFAMKSDSGNQSKRRCLKFSRNTYAEFYDCEIICNNEQSIRCHKCILIARSEYFRNMFMGSWVESNSAKIQLPIDLDLAQIIIDYLYSDEIQMEWIHSNSSSSTSIKSRNERETEVLFNIFILSDQLLVERLKNLCEFKLTNLVNLKNVAEIFEFSNEYEAHQLKEFCMEFISCNLVTLIDTKQLENVDMNLLKELSKFYKSYFPIVDSRIITPYYGGLDPNKIEILPNDIIFDQRFIDGTLNDEDKKKYCNLKEFGEKNHPTASFTSFLDTNQQQVDNIKDELLTMSSKSHDESKWEKVKKKNRRKISENQSFSSKVESISNETNFKVLESVKKSSSSIITNNMIVKSPLNHSLSTRNESIDSSIEIVSKAEEWPGLSEDTSMIKKQELKNKISANLPFSKIKKINTINAKQQMNEKIGDSKFKDDSQPKAPWKIETKNNQSTLLDVINDELKSLTLKNTSSHNKSPVEISKNNKGLSNEFPKTWNINSNSTSNKNVGSFANIVEMEKKSNEHYNKIKNRPLNMIQIEEKAIEDLKKFYGVENCFNMEFTIEIIDDSTKMAPFWQKN